MLTNLRALTKKQVTMAVAALSVFGVVGAVGVTQAAPSSKPTKEQCAAVGMENYGHCVKLWSQGSGYGYAGSGSSVTTITETRSYTKSHVWSFNWFSW